MKLEVIDEDTQHFIMRFNEPSRIEVSLISNLEPDGPDRIIAHAYNGTETDMEQEPDLVFDGTIDNSSLLVESHHAVFVRQLLDEGPAIGQTRL
jgi:hypothetical protein